MKLIIEIDMSEMKDRHQEVSDVLSKFIKRTQVYLLNIGCGGDLYSNSKFVGEWNVWHKRDFLRDEEK